MAMDDNFPDILS